MQVQSKIYIETEHALEQLSKPTPCVSLSAAQSLTNFQPLVALARPTMLTVHPHMCTTRFNVSYIMYGTASHVHYTVHHMYTTRFNVSYIMYGEVSRAHCSSVSHTQYYTQHCTASNTHCTVHRQMHITVYLLAA